MGTIMISRRKLLILGTMALIAGVAGLVFGYRRTTLDAFLDTLIPRDEFGPSATDVGMGDVVRRRARGNNWRFIELELALAWMNLKAGGSFAAANEARRNEIVTRMEEAGSGSVLWKAYNFARTICMNQYYGRAEQALEFGFVGPPQPAGHDEPWAVWKGSADG